MRKTTRKKIAPIVVTVLVILYVLPLIGMLLWAAQTAGGGFRLTFPMLCWAILGGGVIVGIIKALLQRLDEIDRGEEEDASQY